MGRDLADALTAQVIDARNLDTGALEADGGLSPGLVDRHDDGALSWTDCPILDEPARALGEHHADEVVAREDERLLDRPRSDDDVLGPVAVEDPAGIDGHEPAFPDSDRPTGCDHLEIAFDLEIGVFVDENDLLTRGGMGPGGFDSRLAATDHQDVGVPVLDVVATGLVRVRIEAAKARHAAEEVS